MVTSRAREREIEGVREKPKLKPDKIGRLWSWPPEFVETETEADAQ